MKLNHETEDSKKNVGNKINRKHTDPSINKEIHL